MKLRELLELDAELKREVIVYAEMTNTPLEQLLNMSVSEWLELLAGKIDQIAEALINV